MTTSAEYSDDVLLNALRALNDQFAEAIPPRKETLLQRMRKSAFSSRRAQDRKKPSLHDIAALLMDGRRSGLKFELMNGGYAQEKPDEVPWSAASAQALIHAIGDLDFEPVRAAVRRCNDFHGTLQEAVEDCIPALQDVEAELDREDRRIAQISARGDMKNFEHARPCRVHTALLRHELDRLDDAARQFSAAADALQLSKNDIAEYLLIDSAMVAARQISGKAPLRPEDASAQAELGELRVAVERVNSALSRAVKAVEHQNARASAN